MFLKGIREQRRTHLARKESESFQESNSLQSLLSLDLVGLIASSFRILILVELYEAWKYFDDLEIQRVINDYLNLGEKLEDDEVVTSDGR